MIPECRSNRHHIQPQQHLTAAERAYFLYRSVLNRASALISEDQITTTELYPPAMPSRSGASEDPFKRMSRSQPSDDVYAMMWQEMLLGVLQGMTAALLVILVFG